MPGGGHLAHRRPRARGRDHLAGPGNPCRASLDETGDAGPAAKPFQGISPVERRRAPGYLCATVGLDRSSCIHRPALPFSETRPRTPRPAPGGAVAMRSGAVFPWRGDNRFELLVDGARFFPRMLDAIAAAQRQVELELYLVEDGK